MAVNVHDIQYAFIRSELVLRDIFS